MIQFLRLKDARDLQNLSRSEYLRLRSHLKGVVVRVTVSPNVRPKPIADLVEEAGRQEFDNKEGVRVTVSVSLEVVRADIWTNALKRNTSQTSILMGSCGFLALSVCGSGSPRSYLPSSAR